MMKQLTMLMVMVLLVLAITPTSHASRETFQDIESHWARLKIEQGVQKGYVSGFPDGAFRPNEPVTRAQFIRMFADSLQLPSSQGGSPWYQPYVATALEIGVLDQADFSDYTAQISRLEIMRLLSRGLATDSQYAAYLTAYSGLYNGDIPYIDYRDIPDADVKHVAMVIGAGLVSGYPDFSLGLSKTATRAEAVVMIENFLELRLKTPEGYRGLLELKEVAETGTNATTVSMLVPSQNFKKEPISISTKRYDAKIKRAYVVPTIGESSIYERKVLWDRSDIQMDVVNSTPYFVLTSYEVKTKVDMHLYPMEFTSSVYSSATIRGTDGNTYKKAVAAFGYTHIGVSIGTVKKAEKGKTYEVFDLSSYREWHVGWKSGMYLTNSQEGSVHVDHPKYTLFTSDYKHTGW